MQCLMRPAQSGKTRTMQDMIRTWEELAVGGLDSEKITIVVVSKNRSLVSQLHARMANATSMSQLLTVQTMRVTPLLLTRRLTVMSSRG